jgi:phage protein U
MAQIGNLGKLIVFEVSSDKVLTFHDMTQSISGRWAQHSVIGGKPESEYLGPGQRSISLPIFLSVSHGVKPRRTMEKMEKAAEKGTPYPFVLGGKKIGDNQWVISSISESWGDVIVDGKLVSANLTLTLSEYV